MRRIWEEWQRAWQQAEWAAAFGQHTPTPAIILIPGVVLIVGLFVFLVWIADPLEGWLSVAWRFVVSVAPLTFLGHALLFVLHWVLIVLGWLIVAALVLKLLKTALIFIAHGFKLGPPY